MKKLFVLIGLVALVFSFNFKSAVAEEKQHHIIKEVIANVLGDGECESVIISGVKNQDSAFYEEIKITVFEEKSGRLLFSQIPTINCGFEPDILPIDFDGDSVCEIFYSSQNEKGGSYYVYSFLDGAKTLYDFELDQPSCSTKYENYYKLSVNLGKKVVSVDLSNKDKNYLSKLYMPSGKLYKNAKAGVSKVDKVYPIYVEGGYKLLTVRSVTGENSGDVICKIVTLYFLNGGVFNVDNRYAIQ